MQSISDHTILNIVRHIFPSTNPAIIKPTTGLRKACFIVTDGNKQVFVKFDVPSEVYRRTGDIGVSPKLLYSGTYDGIPYVVQEYIQGSHPDRKWIGSHLPQLAAVIQTYHHDDNLKKILSGNKAADYKARLNNDLADLLRRLTNKVNFNLATRKVKNGFQKLLETANELSEVTVVPVHTDPNFRNMIVHEEQILFVDWDEVTLSDPMRDIGVILWWYLPQSQWPLFFHHYRQQLTGESIKKIYWFAARASIEIALWYSENNLGDKGFIADFFAALNCQPNPRQA